MQFRQADDSAGNFDGAGGAGGAGNAGTVFELPKGSASLATLGNAGAIHAQNPADIVADQAGNVYGVIAGDVPSFGNAVLEQADKSASLGLASIVVPAKGSGLGGLTEVGNTLYGFIADGGVPTNPHVISHFGHGRGNVVDAAPAMTASPSPAVPPASWRGAMAMCSPSVAAPSCWPATASR